MFEFDGEFLRNLQEQVEKNQLDIEEHLEQINVLNQFGIRVIGNTLTEEELEGIPTDNLLFGDAYAVGTTTPYNYYIWTRANDTTPTPHWLNIGLFPLPGPASEIPGPKGDTGEQGSRGTNIYAVNSNTPPQGQLINGDLYLNTLNGTLSEYQNGNWIAIGSIRGPQGVQGIPGQDSTVPGPRGERGEKGEKGDTGDPFTVKGTLTSTNELPDPTTVTRTSAYFVNIEGYNHLYVIVGEDELEWFDAGQVTGAKGDKGDTGEQGGPGERGEQGPRGFGWHYTLSNLNTTIGESAEVNIFDMHSDIKINDFVIDSNGFYGVITQINSLPLATTYTVVTKSSLKGSDGATGRAGVNIFRADSYNTYVNNQNDSVVFSSLKGYDSTTGKFNTSIGGTSAVNNKVVRVGDLIYYAGNDAKINTRIVYSPASTTSSSPKIYLRRGSLLPIYQLNRGSNSDYSSWGAGFMTAYLYNRSGTSTTSFASTDVQFTTVNYCFDGNRSFNLNLTFGSDDTQNIYATTDENVFYIKKGDVIIDNRGSTALVTGGYFTNNPTIDYATPSQAYITVSIVSRVPETYTRTTQSNRTYTVYPDGFKELDMRFNANSTEQVITLPFNASFSNFNNACIVSGGNGANLQIRAWLTDATTLHVQTDSATDYTISVLIRGY